MSIPLTTNGIASMAPDAQVEKSARGLAHQNKWQSLGQDTQAIWGLCKGSGKNPYQVAIDLSGPAFKCSCPSRKRPCKHAVGLLLLAQAEPNALNAAEQPDWVRGWLTGRVAQAARVKRPVGQIADAQAQARRAKRRAERVQHGIKALSLWLEDLVRHGLGTLPSEPSFWETQAARLVDAQAPGLARRVRHMATIPATGEGWPGRLLADLARLYLLLESFERLNTLPADLRDEIRSQIGWAQNQSELHEQTGERDHWLVIGQRDTADDTLHIRRTWLWGVQHHHAAMILDFAAPGKPFDAHLVPGIDLDADLVFWPSSFPLRAMVAARHAAKPIASLVGYTSIEDAMAAYGAGLAHTPWLERLAMPLSQVVPLRWREDWIVRDSHGCALPLEIPSREGWRLLSLSGGQPITLVGEWHRQYLEALSVWTGQDLVAIGGAE